jgi:hypothetical protein
VKRYLSLAVACSIAFLAAAILWLGIITRGGFLKGR